MLAGHLKKSIGWVEALPYREFREWQAYYNIEPFGESRADLRSAINACVVANANRGKNTPAFKVDDFMPKFENKKPMTNQEIKNVLKGFC